MAGASSATGLQLDSRPFQNHGRKMQIIDIGANLTHVSFEQDFEDVLHAAQRAGLNHIVLTGTDLETSRASSLMAIERPDYFSSTAGFHPHVAKDVTSEDFAALAKLAHQPEIVAVGETGLDFNRNFSPREDQLRIFEQHLQLAAELQKPLFLHQRDSHEDFVGLLRQYRCDIPGGVVHCFTDSRQALLDYLDLDMYVGITGWICDERRGMELKTLVKIIPDDRLLIETDAPYLLPRSIRPKPKSRRNEPRYLTEVLKVVAECRDQSESEVANNTYQNTLRLFGIEK